MKNIEREANASPKDAALKLALEALEILGWQPTEEAMDYRDNAIAAIKEALAQPEQEPVAVYVGETWCGSVVRLYEDLPLETPLYTTTPQRTYDNMLKAIDSMRPAARVIKDKPATWWLDEFEKVVRNLKEKNT